jgi:hypothetical protein
LDFYIKMSNFDDVYSNILNKTKPLAIDDVLDNELGRIGFKEYCKKENSEGKEFKIKNDKKKM